MKRIDAEKEFRLLKAEFGKIHSDDYERNLQLYGRLEYFLHRVGYAELKRKASDLYNMVYSRLENA